MKAKEIVVGGVYADGKLGVREVISIISDARYEDQRVTYRILAAKVEQEYSYADKKMVSVIGSESQCNLASFSQWARLKVENVGELISELTARKLKLPPGERAFMDSVAMSGVPSGAGHSASFEFNEMRQARGLEKKGLVIVEGAAGKGGDVILTELGAAWIRIHYPKLSQPR